jgi:hypothetical protein
MSKIRVNYTFETADPVGLVEIIDSLLAESRDNTRLVEVSHEEFVAPAEDPLVSTENTFYLRRMNNRLDNMSNRMLALYRVLEKIELNTRPTEDGNSK